jgi:flagellar basal body-associated protein FliL
MGTEDKPRKVVGVYDRPAGADRKRGSWILVVAATVLTLVAWMAYFAFSRT